MKGLLRFLAFIDLIAGTIGSFVLANHFGRTISNFNLYSSRIHYGRDWALTIGIFVGSLFGVLVLFAILMSLAEIREAQEGLAGNSSEEQSNNQTRSENTDESWTCPHCGTSNSNKVDTCVCGAKKP